MGHCRQGVWMCAENFQSSPTPPTWSKEPVPQPRRLWNTHSRQVNPPEPDFICAAPLLFLLHSPSLPLAYTSMTPPPSFPSPALCDRSRTQLALVQLLHLFPCRLEALSFLKLSTSTSCSKHLYVVWQSGGFFTESLFRRGRLLFPLLTAVKLNFQPGVAGSIPISAATI